jgi:hypothetical protein
MNAIIVMANQQPACAAQSHIGTKSGDGGLRFGTFVLLTGTQEVKMRLVM